MLRYADCEEEKNIVKTEGIGKAPEGGMLLNTEPPFIESFGKERHLS